MSNTQSSLQQSLLKLQAAQGRIAFAGRDLSSLDRPALRRLRADMQIAGKIPV